MANQGSTVSYTVTRSPTSYITYGDNLTNIDSILNQAFGSSLSTLSIGANQPQVYQTITQSVVQPQNSSISAALPSGNCKFLPPIPLEQYKLNNDPNPEVIRKKPADIVRYNQEVAVRFLEPPQPPKPGDIVIKQLPNRQIAPAPPLIVRQAPPRPATPPPLVLREAPPQPPARVNDKLILVPGKVIPPPTRKVVVERLPAIPPKPQQVYIEKWLPFKQQKRRVIFERADPDCIIPNPRNLVIQWENPQVEVTREYKNLGTQLVDPVEYSRRHGTSLIRHEEFKSAASRAGAPENVVISNSHVDLGIPDLEGDIEALRLIDLDRNGLSEYRKYVSGYAVSSNTLSTVSAGYGLVSSEDTSNLISIDQVQSILNNLNAGSEKIITEDELRSYFKSIDTNRDGVISYQEFKSAIF